jgi:hypothetical protein
MDYITELKKELRILIYGNKLSEADDTAKKTAGLLGKTLGYLSQICNEKGIYPTPLEVLVPLMKKRRRFKALERIAWECGFLLVKFPTPKKSKAEELEMVRELQASMNKTSALLLEFLKQYAPEAYQKFSEANKEMISAAMYADKYACKKSKGQEELF